MWPKPLLRFTGESDMVMAHVLSWGLYKKESSERKV